ncbi:hypothetical protein JX265_004820 [Neoarthrinium moseri]|uniref:Uncharacterized protein n=1 Tax=Neoarthrinium moseri TaxID=1658444 RepID=A0A9Q0ANE2_9PEZI|nr:uncharacterized protein JN550_003677 [Neoarthrinium moseri]KAI1846850.1 hypothetical protein JX266_007071 [Neoarthrinium moseri]KAI1872803.1 hypothetical protein JN550_003677 [Neoarthrinium moseri]KAI1874612.1 hypothetical protein JX265_004820 [Neoarthrinium moseri]
MASQEYNSHPLPAPPPHGQQSYQNQYSQSPPSAYDQSPLPQPPQPAQQHQSRQQQAQLTQQPSYPQRPPQKHRPRSRGFSFRSDKSGQANGAGGGHVQKVSSAGLHETHEEKESKRLHSKADPTLAMQEAEPSAVARAAVDFDEKPPLSSLQHKDLNGVVIAEPDRSNPTRSKWERPLDTIRSFEAALDGKTDGTISSRQSMYRGDSDSVVNWNRRSSYYGSKPRQRDRYPGGSTHRLNPDSNGPRFPHDSYYGAPGGRPMSTFRPDSAMLDPRGSAMMGGPRDGYYDGMESGPSGGYGGNGGRNRMSRMQTDPHMSTHPAVRQNLYPGSNNHRSYETVASASGGSASMGEPSGYQTDPTSSENSSINRRSPPKQRQEPMNDYGISFGQSPGYQAPKLGAPESQPRTMPDNSHAPTPPPKAGGGSLLRKASKVSGMAGTQRPDMGEKRKSWFSRRFSKNS